MNHEEAKAVAAAYLATFRTRTYNELTALIGQSPGTADIAGPSGVCYQVEVIAVWDNQEGGNVRMMTTVDDGGWRSFAPLSGDDFIMSPTGVFVGE